MGKNFLGLDGLKHFWAKAKSWITAQIAAEVAAKIAEIVANAPEDLNTLKEIADWISAHADDAAAMNTQIKTNIANIESEITARQRADTALQEAINNISSMQANYLRSSGLNTMEIYKEDNNGWPVYVIMNDCTAIFAASSGGDTEGFTGIVICSRKGGYPNESVQAMRAMVGWNEEGLRIGSSLLCGDSYTSPAILKYTGGSSTKYYIALRLSGSNKDVFLLGSFFGTYIGTHLICSDSAGTLPEGYEVYKTA